jgi:hypothetical protein
MRRSDPRNEATWQGKDRMRCGRASMAQMQIVRSRRHGDVALGMVLYNRFNFDAETRRRSQSSSLDNPLPLDWRYLQLIRDDIHLTAGVILDLKKLVRVASLTGCRIDSHSHTIQSKRASVSTPLLAHGCLHKMLLGNSALIIPLHFLKASPPCVGPPLMDCSSLPALHPLC